MGAFRPAQHCRRLLRHHTRAHQGHRRRGGRLHPPSAARDRTVLASLRPGAIQRRPGLAVRQRRRAHQRHRLSQVQAPDHRRQLRRSLGPSPATGGSRRPDHRHQHGRRHVGRRSGDGALPQPDRRRAGYRPRADHDRLLQMERDRGRPQVRAGQAGDQLDFHEGGRGGVPATRPPGSALWRGGDRHGLRRGRPGRHLHAQGGHLRPRLPAAHGTGGLPAGRHHLRPQHLRHRHRHRGACQLRRRFHRGDALDPPEPAPCPRLRRRLQRQLQLPRQ